MRNIYKKIDLSPFLIFVILISFFSGLFKDVLMFLTIILIHETGHVITSLIYKWKIKKIKISICGGFITYDEVIDKPFKEEFLIAISGFLTQTIFYLIIYGLHSLSFISYDFMFLVKKYHYSILIFNLLPVIPLDGSRILSLVLCMFLPFKKQLKVLNFISFLSVFIIIIIFLMFNFNFEISYFLVLSFILSKVYEYSKDVPYLFNRFLFERYKYPVLNKKINILKTYDLSKMKRQRKHYFLINNHYFDERRVLAKKFD